MSAIRVFLRSENPHSHKPQHSASKSLAELAVAAQIAYWIASGISVNGIAMPATSIHLLTDETWTQVKRRIRPSADGITYRLKPASGYVYSSRDFLCSNARISA